MILLRETRQASTVNVLDGFSGLADQIEKPSTVGG